MFRPLDVASSIVTTVLRLGSGARVGPRGSRPAEPLVLYDFEGCPFCRKAREALSILDLDAVIRPCPKGGPGFRRELTERGGKAQFPYLIDPNTGKEMYESDDIVEYLFAEYGDGPPPALFRSGIVNDLTSVLAGLPRLGAGTRYRRARTPEEPLELYSFEASPFCRIVREALCTLELPYLLHNVALGSEGRERFGERSGKTMVPYLIDPNTGREMFESADIVRYLEETYALSA